MKLIESDEWNSYLEEELLDSYEVNINNVSINSNKKFLWKCFNCNGKYESSITNRINKDYKKSNNCPYCSHKKILKGFNDLDSKRKLLLEFWNYEKNTIKPSEIFPYSSIKVWWTCANSHEFLRSLKPLNNFLKSQ